MLKIDVDDISSRSRFDLQKLLYAIPRPFSARLSSGGDGLHIRAPRCADDCWIRQAYDDPMRLDLDAARRRAHLPVSNLLWDVKNGRRAGRWGIVRTEGDIERLLDVHKGTPPANRNYFMVREHRVHHANNNREV